MSLKVDKVQLEIIINNDQARKSLRLLDEALKSSGKELKELPKGSDEWVKKSKEMETIRENIAKVKAEISITGMTLKELQNHQRDLNSVMLHMAPGTTEFNKLKGELSDVNARMKELRGTTTTAKGMFHEMFAAVTLGAIASKSLESMWDGFKESIKEGVDEAVKMQDANRLLMHSVEGDKVKYRELIDLAKQKAGTTLFSLKDFKEAEQFLSLQGRTAEQIKKTINAGTQLATLNKTDLITSVKELDATMEGRLGKGLTRLEKSFKDLTKEQLYNGAMIDLVGEKYKGLAEAEMETMEGKLNLLSKAWLYLKITSGNVFVDDNTGYFSSMITGAIRMLNAIKDNFQVVINMAKIMAVMTAGFVAYKVVLMSISASEALATNIRGTYAAVTGLFTRSQVAAAVSTQAVAAENFTAATSYAAYTGATVGKTGATVVDTLAMEAATEATIALDVATKATPWGFIIGLITAAAAGFMLLASGTKDANSAISDVSLKAKKDIVEEKLKLEELIEVTKDEHATKKQKLEAIEQLNKISPEYLGNITLENIKTLESTESINEYVKSLEKKATMVAINEKLAEIAKRRVDLAAGENVSTTFMQDAGNMITSLGDMATFAANSVASVRKNIAEEDATLVKQKEALLKLAKDQTKVSEESEVHTYTAAKAINLLTKEELTAEKDRLLALGENIYKSDTLRLREVTRILETRERDEKSSADHNAKLLTQFRDLQEDIRKIAEKDLSKKLNETQREIRDVETKYDILIQKARRFYEQESALKPSQVKVLKDNVENLEVQKNDVIKNLLFERERKFAQDIWNLHEKLRVARMVSAEQQQYNVNKAYDEQIEEQTQAVKFAFDEQQAALDRKYNANLISQIEYINESEKLDADRSDYAQRIEGDAANLRRLQAQEEKYRLRDEEEKFQLALSGIRAKAEAKGKTHDEQEIARIENKYKKLLKDATGNELQTQQIIFAMTDETEEYKKNKALETQREISKAMIAETQLMADTFFTISNGNRKASEDAQIASLDKQKQKELSNKKLTEAQKAAIEEKYANLENAAKTKAWKENQKAAEVQAIINGALAVTNIWATTPKVDFGVSTIILIAASIASTIAQLAVITAQKPPQFKDGGYTGFGNPDEVAGVVHKNEYVITDEMLRDPQVHRLVGFLEQKRQQHDVSEGGFQEPGYVIPRQMFKENFTANTMSFLDRRTQYQTSNSTRTEVSNSEELRISASEISTRKKLLIKQSELLEDRIKIQKRIDSSDSIDSIISSIESENEENRALLKRKSTLNSKIQRLDSEILIQTNSLSGIKQYQEKKQSLLKEINLIEQNLTKQQYSEVQLSAIIEKKTTLSRQVQRLDVLIQNHSEAVETVKTLSSKKETLEQDISMIDTQLSASSSLVEQYHISLKEVSVLQKSLSLVNENIAVNNQSLIESESEISRRSVWRKKIIASETDENSVIGLTESASKQRASFSIPKGSLAKNFNSLLIEKAIRTAPQKQASEDSYQKTKALLQEFIVEVTKQTQSARIDKSDTELHQVLVAFTKKIAVLDTLNTTLQSGISSKFVWSEYEQTKKSFDHMKADTSF